MATPFSARLSAILKSRGMSQTDLSAVSGLTPSAINRYVNGNIIGSYGSRASKAHSSSSPAASSHVLSVW